MPTSSARRACAARWRVSPWMGTKYSGCTRLSMSLSSSAAAWPETCTCTFPLWATVAPALVRRLMTRFTAFSLPGTGVAAITTVSPRSMVMDR